VLAHLEARHPASLAVCTLLDKKVRRLTDVPLAYVGFEVPDEFLVGYGLDYREEYRNLPFIALIRQQGREGDIARQTETLGNLPSLLGFSAFPVPTAAHLILTGGLLALYSWFNHLGSRLVYHQHLQSVNAIQDKPQELRRTRQ